MWDVHIWCWESEFAPETLNGTTDMHQFKLCFWIDGSRETITAAAAIHPPIFCTGIEHLTTPIWTLTNSNVQICSQRTTTLLSRVWCNGPPQPLQMPQNVLLFRPLPESRLGRTSSGPSATHGCSENSIESTRESIENTWKEQKGWRETYRTPTTRDAVLHCDNGLLALFACLPIKVTVGQTF